jgi:glycosyltransferase involved in cell wall biosynthesis
VNYLFVHQNFPGQYYHLIRQLLRERGHRVVFISEPNSNRMIGVQRVFYQAPKGENEHTHPNARDWEGAARRAELVAQTAANLKRLGFAPDVIIGHHGWGELLNLPDVFPGVPILGYFEFYYDTAGQDVGYDAEFPVPAERFPRIRAMNVVNHQALGLNQHGQTPTRWQLTRYPDWAQTRIRLMPEGARLDVCRPDPEAATRPFDLNGFAVSPRQRLVTFVARNLEPYRGFHVMMRALPRLLREHPEVRVIMVGGDEVSYGAKLSQGTWRELMQKELEGKYDATRVLFPGQIPYEAYVQLLQRSDAHVYLSYPFVASWSLREALACGCQIVAANVEPVAEFIVDGQRGLLVPGLDPEAVAEAVDGALSDRRRARRLRAGARQFAETHLDMQTHLDAYMARIAEITGRAPSPASGGRSHATQGGAPPPRMRRKA